MSGAALIVFTKNPVPGQVKTRLAARIGDERALRIHKYLQERTLSVISDVDCTVFLFYSDIVPNHDEWSKIATGRLQQHGENLGTRMLRAFEIIFTKGFTRVVIIGTDCYDLSSTHITDAFSALNNHDIVIGPAVDGGYYLLGMKNNLPSLFEGITWSTDSVFEETVVKISALKATYLELPTLRDIDLVDDLQSYDDLLAIAYQ